MIELKIVTPHGIYLNQSVKSIHLASTEGQMTILPNHMPVVAAIVPCRLVLVNDEGNTMTFALSQGFCQFKSNKAQILCDAIEGKAEIDIERAKRSMQRAKERLEKKDSNSNMKRAQLSLERAINRINVYND